MRDCGLKKNLANPHPMSIIDKNHRMTPKTVCSLYVPAELLARFDVLARETGWGAYQSSSNQRGGNHGGRDTGRSALLTHLMTLWVEGRLTEAPLHGVNPFPLEASAPAGSSPEHPALVTRGAPEAPEPARGWFFSEIQGVGIVNLDDARLSTPLTPSKPKD